MSTPIKEKGLSRLDFLKASGALVIAFSLPLTLKAGSARAAGHGAFAPVNPAEMDAWLAVGPDGMVTLFTGKVELGGGLLTGFAQIVAEELDVPFSSMTVVSGDTLLTPNQGFTAGSSSISGAGPLIRQVAADARYALLQHAATHLGVPAAGLTVKAGVVSVKGNPAKSISYADLIGGKHFAELLPVKSAGFGGIQIGGKGVPKKPSQYTTVGQPLPRIDIPDKVTGKFAFVQDVRVPGMLHGRVIRPSGIGSQLISVGSPPKGVRVLREHNFLGVVAENEWDAVQAAQNLPVKWSNWKGLPAMADLYSAIRSDASAYSVVASGGNVSTALGAAKTTLQASYTTPIETHGSIGPSCAVAEIKDGVATVWSGTQDPSSLRANVADLLGLAMDNVRVICVEASGCYGRNGADPAAIDAVIMARLAGRPVRVQWMRWDEHGWDPKSPATVHDLVGGVDAKGQISAWQHEAWIPAQFSTTIIGGTLVGHPLGMGSNGGFDGPMVYNFPSFSQIQHGEGNLFSSTPESVGIISAWMRSPGQFQVNFAMESFVDELASAAGADPVEFRLRHLTDWRLIALLKAVAKAANWQPRTSPQAHALTGKAGIVTGRGVAISNRGGTLNAQVSEVEVNRATGEIQVTHVFAGQDNGLTINPRAVKLHMEGAITQSVSRTLLEEVTFDQSNITSTDWSTYPILTFKGAPVIETLLIDRPELPATGVGEPSVNPVAPSIANAVFDAIGVRIRQLPMRPDRVKAALAQALQAAATTKS